MPNTAHFRQGDKIWSPNGENEWCEVTSVASTASWQYTRPSTGVSSAGPQDLKNYKPDHLRPASSSDWPPKPNGAN
jgi:hypothetical protein